MSLPYSFYADSRKQTEVAIEERIQAILSEGGQIIDLGGYSSRPDAAEVSPEEEMKRLAFALKILNTHYPDVTLSVDTFRADVARRCVEEYGVAIINDISGGELDAGMFETVARLHVPYIMMHMRGTPQTMQQHTDYADIMEEIMLYFARKVRQLRLLGVNDIYIGSRFRFPPTCRRTGRTRSSSSPKPSIYGSIWDHRAFPKSARVSTARFYGVIGVRGGGGRSGPLGGADVVRTSMTVTLQPLARAA